MTHPRIGQVCIYVSLMLPELWLLGPPTLVGSGDTSDQHYLSVFLFFNVEVKYSYPPHPLYSVLFLFIYFKKSLNENVTTHLWLEPALTSTGCKQSHSNKTLSAPLPLPTATPQECSSCSLLLMLTVLSLQLSSLRINSVVCSKEFKALVLAWKRRCS